MLTREQIRSELKNIIAEERVITDEAVLELSSCDRFLKYETICGVYSCPIPAAVVEVESTEEVSKVLKFANDNAINVVPRTGQSATEGGLETVIENTIVLDGSRINKIYDIDIYNMQVTCGCGVPLETLDNLLMEKGYFTGHSPQSKPLAQMGGLVATRSIGQFSTLYGGIEDMLVGLEAVLPDGKIVKIKNVPRRAAGPDIRHIITGNEGALCFITEVTVKLFKYMPENRIFMGYLLENMKTGFNILREVMVEGYRPAVARLYDGPDGSQHFSHFSEGKCVLVFMAEGTKSIAEVTAEGIKNIIEKYDECKKVETKLIERWFENLNWGPDKVAEERIEIAETQNVGFTTEVSGCWGCINEIYESAKDRIIEEIPDITLMGGHSSHSYLNGTNMYFIYYYNIVDCKPTEEIIKYHDPINKIICEETIKYGGSIVHHHGIGKHRTAWVKEEYQSSYCMLETLKKAFDPNGIMNKGTIFPIE